MLPFSLLGLDPCSRGYQVADLCSSPGKDEGAARGSPSAGVSSPVDPLKEPGRAQES